MAKASRAIIIEGDKILVMYRNKYGSEYFTLPGGRADSDESPEQTLVREVKEETGLEITNYQLVFTEEHQAPYNEQYIYLCEAAPHQEVQIQNSSEEALLNNLGANIHKPLWANKNALSRIAFRTPQLQQAIVDGIAKGFPSEPVKL